MAWNPSIKLLITPEAAHTEMIKATISSEMGRAPVTRNCATRVGMGTPAAATVVTACATDPGASFLPSSVTATDHRVATTGSQGGLAGVALGRTTAPVGCTTAVVGRTLAPVGRTIASVRRTIAPVGRSYDPLLARASPTTFSMSSLGLAPIMGVSSTQMVGSA